MLNPPASYPNSGPDLDLAKRITQRMQQGKIDDQILEIVKEVFEKELVKEKILLSHPEKVRLFRKVIKAVLTDMLVKIDRDK